MKGLKLIVLSAIVAAMSAAGLAVAGTPPGCNATGLEDILLPSGGTYHVGETICYEIRLAITAPVCDLQNATVTFWRPDDPQPNPSDVCGSVGGHVIASGLYIAQGAPQLIYDCVSHPAILHYTVREEDLEPDGTLHAFMCVEGTQLVGPPTVPSRDEKQSVNFILTPCVEVTKSVDCDTSKVGDEVIYTIEVCNCDPVADLNLVSIDDNLLGSLSGSFSSVLPAGQCETHTFNRTVLADDPDPLVNEVTVNYQDVTGYAVSDYDDAEVVLVHPDFTVTKVCQTDPVPLGGMAEFLVTVENTGDVRLDLTTDEAAIGPFSLNPGGTFTQTILQGPAVYPQECNSIEVTATIPFCGLPNIIVRSDDDCCPVECPPPCVEITKSVACDTSKVGDEVIYTICVENCGQFDLTGVVVTDEMMGTLAGFPSTLTPGQQVCLDFPYTILETDEPGPVANQAHVVAVDACDGTTQVGDDSELVLVTLVHPDFTVTKECTSVEPLLPGATAEYLVTVENTGDVRMDFTAVDAATPAIPPFSLDPGEMFSQTVSLADAQPPCIENIVTVTGTIPFCDLTNEIVRADTACCVTECPPPCVEITKSVACDTSKVGDEVIYTICVENCGQFDLTGVVVTDEMMGTLAGFPSTLTPGQQVCLDFPYTILETDEPGPVANQAHVVAVDACDGTTQVGDDSELVLVTLVHPCLEVTKACTSPDPLEPGATAEFLVTVENCGDVALDCTTDEPGMPASFSLDAGDTLMWIVTMPVPADAVDEVCNYITIDGTIPFCELPNELSASDTACCEVGGQQGCTPGFWKNHPDCWECFTPTTLVGSVFMVPSELSDLADDTLMEALRYKGGDGTIGAARNLLRIAVAAILDACDPDINYPMDLDDVIEAVNAALATLDRTQMGMLQGRLDGYNNLGCPIDAHCNPQTYPVIFGAFDQPEASQAIRTEQSLPREFAVTGVVPNPLSGSTTVNFALPSSGEVTVDIYDTQGRRVAALVGGDMPAGHHTVVWNGTDTRGNTVASGLYFCKVSFGDQLPITKKLVKAQ